MKSSSSARTDRTPVVLRGHMNTGDMRSKRQHPSFIFADLIDPSFWFARFRVGCSLVFASCAQDVKSALVSEGRMALMSLHEPVGLHSQSFLR